MNRRFFSQSMGAAAWLSTVPNAGAKEPAANRSAAIYRLDHLYVREGSQGARVNGFFASQIPLLAGNTEVFGVFAAVVGPHLPALTVLSGFPSFQAMEAADTRIQMDAEYRRALAKLEGDGESPFYGRDRMLFRATDSSPAIVPLPQPPKAPRIFELQVYHSPTTRQHRSLHERLAGPKLARFHSAGIYPVLFADNLSGPKVPGLTCLIPFDSLADREKAWAALHADSDGRRETPSEVSLWRPTPFSPIQ